MLSHFVALKTNVMGRFSPLMVSGTGGNWKKCPNRKFVVSGIRWRTDAPQITSWTPPDGWLISPPIPSNLFKLIEELPISHTG
jgi:hypothetical protein